MIVKIIKLTVRKQLSRMVERIDNSLQKDTKPQPQENTNTVTEEPVLKNNQVTTPIPMTNPKPVPEGVRKKTTYTEEFKEQVLKEHKNSDLSYSELAEKYNIPQITIQQWNTQKYGKVGYPDRYPQELRDKVVKEFKTSDLTLTDLERKYGPHRSTIRKWVRRACGPSIANREKLKKGNHYTEELKNKIVEEYKSGETTLKELSEKYGPHYSTISNWVSKEKEQPVTNSNYTNRYPTELKRHVVKLYNEGNVTLKELSEEYGMSGPSITNWKKELSKEIEEGV